MFEKPRSKAVAIENCKTMSSLPNSFQTSGPIVADGSGILAIAAREFLQRDRLDLAEHLVERALVENEKSADAQSVMANILDRKGNWQAYGIDLANFLFSDDPFIANVTSSTVGLSTYTDVTVCSQCRHAVPACAAKMNARLISVLEPQAVGSILEPKSAA
jgi:hypothetical protein